MPAKPPSRTAREAAAHRALHQILENGAILEDPFAALVLGEQGMADAEIEASDTMARLLRLYLAARSRFAEDTLAAAVARGVRQSVILGAGLDTFALRNPYAGAGLRVFEVDIEATQVWKRARLAQASIAIPGSLTFVPADFERDDLGCRLHEAGFQPEQPAFFIWLGVVSYLTRDAIDATLRFVASLPNAEIVFDYGDILENYPPALRTQVEALAAWVVAKGEPWLTLFDPATLANDLRAMGLSELEDLSPKQLAGRYYGDSAKEVTCDAGAHIIWAR